MKKIRFIGKTIVFCVIFVILFSGATYVLRDKLGAEYIYNFYEEPEDTLDVLFFGSSHMYKTVQPMELWNDYGIASYNLGSSEQSVPLSYYLLKDSLRYQKPKLVVLDIYMLFVGQKDYTHERIHQVVDNMPWSVAKCQAIMDLLPSEEWMYFFFNIGQYHSRWSELQGKDYRKIVDLTKGSDFYSGRTPLETVRWNDSLTSEIPEIPMKYLNKIVELCDKNDIELLFTLSPYVPSEKQMGIFNTFAKEASEKGWVYLNLFEHMDELNVRWDEDFAEEQHVNLVGSLKVTRYLGQFLKENYEITDHRGEDSYASWDTAYKKYEPYRDKFSNKE